METIDKINYRGKSIGDTSVSEKHTNFLINNNLAKSLDLEILGEEIREQVKKCNINLDWELIRIGKFKKFKKKIVILGGGISDEKEISDLTSKEVYNTLKNKYDVSLIDVTQNCEKLITNLLSFKPDVVFNCLHGFW